MVLALKYSRARRIVVAGIALFFIGVSGAGQRVIADDRDGGRDDDRDDVRVARGFAIAPVPLNLRGKNRELVGLGSYLVNAVGGCNDCHTNPSYAVGGNPFLAQPKVVNSAHYLAGGQAFGPFVSRNLTPDTTGKPAGLTLEKFIHIIRTGEDDDHVPPNVPSVANDLLQVMPWPTYQDMSTRDLRAIYEYLRAIPHAEP